MKQFALTLLTTLAIGTAYAASHAGAPMPEAMKPGNTQAEDAAQKNTDAKSKMGAAPSGPMPEAMAPSNEKAKAAAESKARPKTGKKNSTDEQMMNDARKQ
jgi:hypothetical protein